MGDYSYVGQLSDSQAPPWPAPNQSTHPIPKEIAPLPIAQHPQIVGQESNADGTSSHPPPLKSPHTTGLAPGSPEWMHAWIAQLEAKLDNARAVCNMALSEHNVIQQAYQAKQNAHQEVMTQKIAAEAELSQKAGKQSQLCVELDNALLQELVLSEDNNTLCGLLTLAEGEIKQVGLLMDQSEKSREWVKALKLKLEEAQGQAQKLQMQKSQLEQQNNSNNIELTSTKDKLKKAKLSESTTTKGQDLDAKEQCTHVKTLGRNQDSGL
ncbi:hypothetical protein B0J17DRAFT_725111 [Rhizoctonia solani]|nr:hypothetical protein B0J17DRAFT_725111 [Rhizoctonia solani]